MIRIVRKAVAKAMAAAGLLPGRDGGGSLSPYECALHTLLTCREKISVVIVGANDGRVNDPVYDFCRSFPGRTSVIAVEPQRAVIPFLEENYQWHPDFLAVNAAVGEMKELTLYSVDPMVWDQIDAPYARGWPTYRAPTGVTSSERSHVLSWLSKHRGRVNDIESSILEMRVECMALAELLSRFAPGRAVDVLQIDVEGSDDLVIYASNIAQTRPSVIYFEKKYLPDARYRKLADFLGGLGYQLFEYRHDALALRIGGDRSDRRAGPGPAGEASN